MRKLAFAGSVLLVAAALSCTRELEVVQPTSQEYVFDAVWADGNGTRTALQSDGTSVWWTTGEEINVFYGALASSKFTSTNTEAAPMTSFSGSLPIISGSIEGGNSGQAFWGVYPYDDANTCDGESVTLTVPSRQPAKDGSFADKFFPAVAMSRDFALAFYNVCGGARFSVANEGINAVTFEALGGENLVGKVKVAFGSDGKPVVQQVTAGSVEVTVKAPSGGFVPGKYYFAAFLPGTLSHGFKVTYRTASQSASISLDQSLTVNRSRFGTIEKKDQGLTFVDGGGASGYSPPTPEAIDLGLPSGLKWASFNLGATKPEEYGDYFAWGETEPYYVSLDPLIWKPGKEAGYDWPSYKWFIGDADYITKYCDDDRWGYNGFMDGMTVLYPEDDAAHVNLGGKWRMPTEAEQDELLDYCSWDKDEEMNGIKGLTLIGPNGNSIFLPYAGDWYGTRFWDGGGSYWSSSLSVSPGGACYLDLFDMFESEYDSWRYEGLSIRPVYGDSSIILVESVSLNKTELELIIGEGFPLVATVLPENATTKTAFWSSNKESVAKVSSTGVVVGLSAGTAIITVTTADGSKTATCTVTVKENSSSSMDIPDAVDLGLPSGLKWASFNLGASAPEECGNYYAWGETEPKGNYSWATYKWCNGSEYSLTKYCANADFGYNGFTDNKTVLDPEDDAAHVNLGGNWRMPKESEMDELMKNCTWRWTTQNGVTGCLVTGPNGNSIFLPAAGVLFDSDFDAGSDGYYWSSSRNPPYPPCAPIAHFYLDYYYFDENGDCSYNNFESYYERFFGFSVRPVIE